MPVVRLFVACAFFQFFAGQEVAGQDDESALCATPADFAPNSLVPLPSGDYYPCDLMVPATIDFWMKDGDLTTQACPDIPATAYSDLRALADGVCCGATGLRCASTFSDDADEESALCATPADFAPASVVPLSSDAGVTCGYWAQASIDFHGDLTTQACADIPAAAYGDLRLLVDGACCGATGVRCASTFSDDAGSPTPGSSGTGAPTTATSAPTTGDATGDITTPTKAPVTRAPTALGETWAPTTAPTGPAMASFATRAMRGAVTILVAFLLAVILA